MKHPVYIGWVALWSAFLLLANLRGWSAMHAMSPARWFGGSAATGISHK